MQAHAATTTPTPKQPTLTLAENSADVYADVVWQGKPVRVRIALDLSGQTGLIPGCRPNGQEMPSVRVTGGASVGAYPVRNVFLDGDVQGRGMSLLMSASVAPGRVERLLVSLGITPIMTLDGVRAAIRAERALHIAACPGHQRAERREVPFRGPLADAVTPNPYAHGGNLVTERCLCGAERNTNVRGIYVETGVWS